MPRSPLLLLLLTACTEVPYIPVEPPPLGSDTGDTGAEDIPCSVDQQPLTEAIFTVVNGSAADADLFWRSQSCGEGVYAYLGPGGSHEQASVVGHVWVLRDKSGGLVGWFELTEPGPVTLEVN